MFVDAEGGVMMNKEAQDHEFTETATLESGRETSDARGSSKDRQHSKRSMPAIRDRHRSVLYVGETCPSRSPVSIAEREERTEGVKAGRNAKVRGGEPSCFVLWLSRRKEVVIAELSMENLELKKGGLV